MGKYVDKFGFVNVVVWTNYIWIVWDLNMGVNTNNYEFMTITMTMMVTMVMDHQKHVESEMKMHSSSDVEKIVHDRFVAKSEAIYL